MEGKYPQLSRYSRWDSDNKTLVLFSFLDQGMDFRRRNPLRDFVALRKNEGKEVPVLDLMSYGSVLKDLDVKGGAVGLSDHRNLIERVTDRIDGRWFLTRDLSEQKSWEDIQDKSEGIKYPLILCRPFGGLRMLPRTPAFYQTVFNHIYQLLSGDDGVFLTEFHKELSPFVMKQSVRLNRIPGIDIRVEDGKLLLAKGPEAPKYIS